MLQRFTGVSGILASMGMMEQADLQKEFANLYFDIAGDPEPVALEGNSQKRGQAGRKICTYLNGRAGLLARDRHRKKASRST